LPGFTSTAEIKSDESITIKREREREENIATSPQEVRT